MGNYVISDPPIPDDDERHRFHLSDIRSEIHVLRRTAVSWPVLLGLLLPVMGGTVFLAFKNTEERNEVIRQGLRAARELEDQRQGWTEKALVVIDEKLDDHRAAIRELARAQRNTKAAAALSIRRQLPPRPEKPPPAKD